MNSGPSAAFKRRLNLLSSVAAFTFRALTRIKDVKSSKLEHTGAAGLSFADGHSEVHKWKGSKIKAKVSYRDGALALNVAAGDSVRDVIWWSQNTTVRYR